jgi:hypothetical protein
MLFVLISALAAPAADEAVLLELRREKAGDKTAVVRTSASTLTLSGGDETRKDTTAQHLEYDEEIVKLPADADRPVKLTRNYTKATRSSDGKETEFPFHKKLVEIERQSAGRYGFVADGEQFTGEAARLFEDEFNLPDAYGPDRELLPPQPVKIGEAWQVSSELVAKRMTARGPFSVEAANVTMTSKLVKLLERDGAKFAVVEQTIETRPTALVQGERKTPLDGASKITTSVTWEFCRDGSRHESKFAGKSIFAIALSLPGGAKLSLTGEGTTTRTTRPRK